MQINDSNRHNELKQLNNSTHTHRTHVHNNQKLPDTVNLVKPDTLFNSLAIKNAPGKALPHISFDNPKTVNNTTEHIAKGTGYFPNNSRMEGGFKDKQGHKLYTLQEFLSGKAPYVSIALDKKLYKSGKISYGDKFSIPELEKKYGRKIEFRAVDTGGAFTGKSFGRVDICTASKHDSLDPTINGKLTLIKS